MWSLISCRIVTFVTSNKLMMIIWASPLTPERTLTIWIRICRPSVMTSLQTITNYKIQNKKEMLFLGAKRHLVIWRSALKQLPVFKYYLWSLSGESLSSLLKMPQLKERKPYSSSQDSQSFLGKPSVILSILRRLLTLSSLCEMFISPLALASIEATSAIEVDASWSSNQ